MKECSECSVTKSVSEFYRAANGNPANVCKECHKRRMFINRRTNPEVQLRERARAKRPERKQMARKISQRWRQEHPEAYRAHTAVNNAVRDKRLVKEPCAICGTTKNVHGHHKDYSKPLDVKWLCAKCHHRIHATFPELGGHAEATP